MFKLVKFSVHFNCVRGFGPPMTAMQYYVISVLLVTCFHIMEPMGQTER